MPFLKKKLLAWNLPEFNDSQNALLAKGSNIHVRPEEKLRLGEKKNRSWPRWVIGSRIHIRKLSEADPALVFRRCITSKQRKITTTLNYQGGIHIFQSGEAGGESGNAYHIVSLGHLNPSFYGAQYKDGESHKNRTASLFTCSWTPIPSMSPGLFSIVRLPATAGVTATTATSVSAASYARDTNR